MNRFGFAIIVMCLFTGWLLAQTPAGDYAPKDGRFTIAFPGKPKESSPTAKSTLGNLKVFTATYATAEGNTYLASYNDFPDSATKPDNRASIFDGIRDGLKAKDGTILSDQEITIGVNKIAGRELVVSQGKQKMRFRVVLRGDRLYQIAVIGTAEFVDGKDAAKFLDSFEITL